MILAGLASQLILYERIRTTETKAKRLRPVADRLVTLGKQGSVHARRQALSLIEDREVIHKLFAEVAPRFAERNGGYTRVLKLGPRQGDAAPMAIIEFVEESVQRAPQAEDQGRRRRGLRRRRRPDAGRGAEEASRAAAEATEEEPGVIQGTGEEATEAQEAAAAGGAGTEGAEDPAGTDGQPPPGAEEAESSPRAESSSEDGS